MAEANRSKQSQSEKDYDNKVQELVPHGREHIDQGQQFDEMQRQRKNPDGKPREKEES